MEEEIRFDETGLTKEKLRSYKGLENLSDEKAAEIISTLKKLSHLTYKYFSYVKEVYNKHKGR